MDEQEILNMDFHGYHAGLVFQTVVMSLSALAGLGGNIIFIALFFTHKHLQTYANYLYLHRAVADICFLTMFPIYVFTIAKGYFAFGLSTCWVVSAFVQCGILASNALLIPIGIHCYMCGKQQNYSSSQRAFFVKVAVRIIAVIAVVSVAGVFTTTEISGTEYGVPLCVEGPLFSGVSAFSVISVCFVMVVPLVGVWTCVILTYVRKPSTQAASAVVETSTEELEEQEERKRIVLAQQRLLVALAVAFTVCQVPFWIAQLLTHVAGMTVALYLMCIVLSLLEINLALSPVLYFWHTKDLLQALRGSLPTHSSGMVPLE